jgi:hypothetical protein
MKLILSGEGPTDIGDWGQSDTGEKYFRPGPMAHFVDILLTPILGYSQLDVKDGNGAHVLFIGEGELKRRGKSDPIVLRGKKAGKGSGLLTKNAQALGLIAIDEAKRFDTPVIAVLFRDGDGTQSRDDWNEKRASIGRGFERVEFKYGVPMIPHPKSEAWILCALKKGYQSCESLESRSGNDASPHSLKAELAKFLDMPVTRDSLNTLIQDERIQPERIDMPSFNDFKERLINVAQDTLC